MNRRILSLLVLSSAFGSGGFVAAQDPAGRSEAAAPVSESGSSDSGEGDDGADANTREVNEGDSKVKVFRFSGLDISGRLKSPQLLYFLNRLRAEFDRPKLPHRSFMPEMERSTKSKAF